jgi:hypothetical protein
MYTIYYSQKNSDLAFVSAVIILVRLPLFYSRTITQAYDEDYRKISKMIEIVRKGKNLPELEKLRTWKG